MFCEKLDRVIKSHNVLTDLLLACEASGDEEQWAALDDAREEMFALVSKHPLEAGVWMDDDGYLGYSEGMYLDSLWEA